MNRIRALAIIFVLFQAGACAESQSVSSSSGEIRVTTVAGGLEHPWGLAFLPDGSMLVTERPGRLRFIDAKGEISKPVTGLPEIFAEGQGGLLDVALDPAFESNRWVYLSYAEPGKGGASTAVLRGRLEGDGLRNTTVIFRQAPKVSGDKHFGSRLAFGADGLLFIALGERFKFDPAQDLSGHLGKVVRIRSDGSVPPDNPFANRSGARPEIWSYGHRNIQAAAVHPQTGALWVIEHGPKGGDEINIAQPGKNFGWPLVSKGDHYDGRDIPEPSTRPDLTQAILQWTPVIAPSGMAFCDGKLFPRWQGNLLVGGLVARGIVRVAQDGNSAREEERIALGARIRDVVQGPDGAIYALTDESNGKVLRLAPAGR